MAPIRRSALSAAAILLVLSLLLASASSASAGIRGIDVSRFQGQIGWKRVGETKIRFAFIQASRGSGGDCVVVPEQCAADPFYDRNVRGARKQRIRVGAYHRAFASGPGKKGAKQDAREEANVFIASVGRLRGGDLKPVLDVESPFVDLSEANLRVWIRVWLNRVERKLGTKPIIYTNNSSWLETGNTTKFAIAGNPLWVANFDVPRPLVPARFWAGKGWSIWQYTSSGHVRGIDGNVDKNRLARGFRKILAR